MPYGIWLWLLVISWRNLFLKIGVVLAKKAGEEVSGFQHGAVLTGCRKTLLGTGWTISHLVSTNRSRNHSSPHVKVPFLDL